MRRSLISGVAALGLGGLLGLATVAGLHERTVPAAPLYPRAALVAGPAIVAAPACDGCTTYDAGYRWAAARVLDDGDACFDLDWPYQRGCMAYVRGGRIG